MKRILTFSLTFFGMGAATADYEEGQIWKYKARTGEEASLVYIVKIDKQYKRATSFTYMLKG